MPEPFDTSVIEIQDAYARLGHRLGWRFLATPRGTLCSDAKLAFVTLNPGGDGIDPAHGVESCEAGSAYVHESWGGCPAGVSPLQRQVRAMFRWLGADPDRVLSGYFIPFRSPSLAALSTPIESFAFGVTLWRRLFASMNPSLVVCIGKDVERGLLAIWGRPVSTNLYPVGWSPQSAALGRYEKRTLLRLPHLSRFRIFGRPQSAEPLEAIRIELQRRGALPGQ